MAFSHETESAGGICKLHGALHEGLVPQFKMSGEFTLDSHHNGTEQASPLDILEHFKYQRTSPSLLLLKPLLVCVAGDRGACLQAIGVNGNTVCMRKLVRIVYAHTLQRLRLAAHPRVSPVCAACGGHYVTDGIFAKTAGGIPDGIGQEKGH
jgi:hypothetical protein